MRIQTANAYAALWLILASVALSVAAGFAWGLFFFSTFSALSFGVLASKLHQEQRIAELQKSANESLQLTREYLQQQQLGGMLTSGDERTLWTKRHGN